MSSAALPNTASISNGLRAWPWYVLAIAVIGLDQYTKALATATLHYGQPLPVWSWFNLTLQHNSGAAFSFLSDAGGWQRYFFTAIAWVVSSVLVVWIYRLPRGHSLLALSLALILGGAIGNVWDRMMLGYVVDFISVHYQNSYFPAFNLADAAISAGAVGMVLDSFRVRSPADEQVIKE